MPRASRPAPRNPRAHLLPLLGLAAVLATATGCLTPGRHVASHAEVARAARPILDLDPDANWTACFNRLVELGSDSIDYLMRQPVMTRPAAPDDLAVFLHTSLVSLLASPHTAPRLSGRCLETSLDILHFDIRVKGRSVGTIVLDSPRPPPAWHQLYPLDFDHALASQIDVEADRRALREWWLAHGDRKTASRVRRRPLRPNTTELWAVLSRRYADGWFYEPEPRPVLCASGPPRQPVLLQLATYDYNLVRAVCVWLGSLPAQGVRERLIDLIGSRTPVLSYNAMFALRYVDDPRIKSLLDLYGRPPDESPPP